MSERGDDAGLDSVLAPGLEPVLNLVVKTKLVSNLAGLPSGERGIFDIVEGHFEGPRLRGQVLPTGGDWTTRTSAGSRMDVRMLLRTDDGITIALRYTGCASQSDGRIRLEIAGQFDAPEGAYAWLNSVLAFGPGTPTADGVRYQLFRFK